MPIPTLDHNWEVAAACKNMPIEDFYPLHPSKAQKGLRICSSCPVKLQCRITAIELKEPHGTWGGMTEWERRRLLRNGVDTRLYLDSLTARLNTNSTNVESLDSLLENSQ